MLDDRTRNVSRRTSTSRREVATMRHGTIPSDVPWWRHARGRRGPSAGNGRLLQVGRADRQGTRGPRGTSRSIEDRVERCGHQRAGIRPLWWLFHNRGGPHRRCSRSRPGPPIRRPRRVATSHDGRFTLASRGPGTGPGWPERAYQSGESRCSRRSWLQ